MPFCHNFCIRLLSTQRGDEETVGKDHLLWCCKTPKLCFQHVLWSFVSLWGGFASLYGDFCASLSSFELNVKSHFKPVRDSGTWVCSVIPPCLSLLQVGRKCLVVYSHFWEHLKLQCFWELPLKRRGFVMDGYILPGLKHTNIKAHPELLILSKQFLS